MITILSSPKPGSGVSTTAALLALAVRLDTATHIVDLCGDQTALLGLSHRPYSSVAVAPRLTVHDLTDAALGEQVGIIDRLSQLDGHVIIDAGTPTHAINDRVPAATVRRWVLRPCYLALRRVANYSVRPDEVIMLDEPGRSLTANDIVAVTGAPVTATVEIRPHVARATDAGLLCARVPATTVTALTELAHPRQAARR